MTEEVDPPKTDNNQPPRGETGGENNDSSSPRLPTVSESGTLPMIEVKEPDPETIRAFQKNPLGLIYALGLLFLNAFIALLLFLLYRNLDENSANIITSFGGRLFWLIVVAYLITILFLIVEWFDRKKRSAYQKNDKSVGDNLGSVNLSDFNQNQKDFIDQLGTLKDTYDIKNDAKIAKIMLENKQFDVIEKELIKGYGFKSSQIFQEGSNEGFVELKYPFTAPRVFAIYHLIKGEKKDKHNKGSINLNLAHLPVTGTKDMWWIFPWSEALINIALIANESSVSRILSQLMDAYKMDKTKNLAALQLAYKISLIGARINRQVLGDLLMVIGEDKLYIKRGWQA